MRIPDFMLRHWHEARPWEHGESFRSYLKRSGKAHLRFYSVIIAVMLAIVTIIVLADAAVRSL